jgi:hypothetical protein
MDAIIRMALERDNAITIQNNICFPRAIDTSTVRDLTWLVHESVHVVDYQNAGVEAFLKTYIQQAIVKGFRHDAIPHEIRANRLEAAAEKLLNRSPELLQAVHACDGDEVIRILRDQKDALRRTLNDSFEAVETLEESPRPDAGGI